MPPLYLSYSSASPAPRFKKRRKHDKSKFSMYHIEITENFYNKKRAYPQGYPQKRKIKKIFAGRFWTLFSGRMGKVSGRELVRSALRPSLPQRAGSGHLFKATLTGRFAGLDLHALASGLRYSQVTDEDACGAGSGKGDLFSKYLSAKQRIRISSIWDTWQGRSGYHSPSELIRTAPVPNTNLCLLRFGQFK